MVTQQQNYLITSLFRNIFPVQHNDKAKCFQEYIYQSQDTKQDDFLFL